MPGKNRSHKRGDAEQTWDLKDIQRLIDLLIDREITEFEMEKGGFRIRIKRGNAQGAGVPAETSSLGISSAPLEPLDSPSIPAAPPPIPAGVADHTTQESTEGLHIIKSPIVGTFYAAPAPDALPFVKVGDVVKVGHVLCIIEAMKLMNDIEAEVAGEVVRIYVENGQPVEYGQSLFAIKPSLKR